MSGLTPSNPGGILSPVLQRRNVSAITDVGFRAELGLTVAISLPVNERDP